MAFETLTVDTDPIAEMGVKLSTSFWSLVQYRREIANLLDELTEADWNNTDSHKFARHFKRGEEKVDADENALRLCVINHLPALRKIYDQLCDESEAYFNDSFWTES